MKVTVWAVAVLVGYVALLAAIYRFLDWPWNVLVASLVLFKGTVFLAVTNKLGQLGTGRRPPPK